MAVSPLHIQSCRPLLTPALRLSQRFLLWVFGAAPGFACMRCASFKPFWHLALASQAPVAIVLEGPRRFRGAVLFRGPRPSSMLGAPFWPSGLTVRRSRPPSAAAELRALVPSYSRFMQAAIYSSASHVSKAFKPFWPPALASQAPPAILLAALRRFRGPAVFPGLRTSSRPGAPFWPSGLTLRSSGRLRRRLPWPLATP